MKYDYEDKINNLKGFYEWNKNHFFSIDKSDDRYDEIINFKKENGFYPDEAWSLYTSICIFILPRLKYMRQCVEKVGCHPICVESNKEWLEILDKMIWSFENANDEEDKDIHSLMDANDWDYKEAADEHYKKLNEGLDLFAKYFMHLWW